MKVVVAWDNNVDRLDLAYQWGVLKELANVEDVDVTYLGRGWSSWDHRHPGISCDAVVGYDYKWSGWLGLDAVVHAKLRYHILGDYFPYKRQQQHHDNYLDTVRFDHIFARGWYECMEAAKRREEPVSFMPFDVDLERFKMVEVNGERVIDVACLGSNQASIFKYRKVVMEELEKGVGDGVRLVTGVVRGPEYIETLRRSKIFVVANSEYRNVSPKYLEAMASGCVVLAQRPFNDKGLDFAQGYGFVDEDHLVYWDNIDQLLSLIDGCLSNTVRRVSIAKRGQRLAVHRHSSRARAKALAQRIRWDLEGGSYGSH
jgi:glycosyltransferase involved in cell wall biosynthesis